MDEQDGQSEGKRARDEILDRVLLPAWIACGFMDYLVHRRSRIETTSGTHESLTHLLMLASASSGVLARLFFESNESVIAIMGASALAHEAIVLWDIAYATKARPPSATEQHIHSFLEVLPFTQLALTVCAHPKPTAALIGLGFRKRRLVLQPKKAIFTPFNVTIVLAATIFQIVPYVEEFIRCYRHWPSLLPRRLA